MIDVDVARKISGLIDGAELVLEGLDRVGEQGADGDVVAAKGICDAGATVLFVKKESKPGDHFIIALAQERAERIGGRQAQEVTLERVTAGAVPDNHGVGDLQFLKDVQGQFADLW